MLASRDDDHRHPTPAARSALACERRSRTTGTRGRDQQQPRTIAAVVARPGSRNSNGATTTSAANPVTADIHARAAGAQQEQDRAAEDNRGEPQISRVQA